ncbi:MAG: plasmid partitioning protein RepB [Rhizobiaceae bacterium]
MTKRRESLKDILTPITSPEFSAENLMPYRQRPQVTSGALQSMNDAISGLSQEAESLRKALAEGYTIVELEPNRIDSSFVKDRLDDYEGEEFAGLVESIRENGQAIPVLVRPHPEEEGRYQLAFGHRRVAALRALGLKVKAFVREMSDEELVVAQGNENLERKDLSFIERALFAFRLEERGMSRSIIMSTFGTSSKGVLSEMIGLARRLPISLIEAIGPAPGIGRPRWIALAEVLEAHPMPDWKSAIDTSSFMKLESADRFEAIFKLLKNKPARNDAVPQPWAPADKTLRVSTKQGEKALLMTFTLKDGKAFGDWISSNLDSLYEAFRKSEKDETGD